jgi:hypothetical protein
LAIIGRIITFFEGTGGAKAPTGENALKKTGTSFTKVERRGRIITP